MEAHVEVHLDGTGRVAHDDERIVDDPSQHEVAGGRDLRLVRQEHPGAPEDLLAFELEHGGIAVDVGRDHAPLDVVGYRPRVAHRTPPAESSSARPAASSRAWWWRNSVMSLKDEPRSGSNARSVSGNGSTVAPSATTPEAIRASESTASARATACSTDAPVVVTPCPRRTHTGR